MKHQNIKKILLVEDEHAIMEMLSLILTRANFDVLTATSLDAARAQLSLKPDLIVLDWMLPDGNGVHFAQELRKQDSTKTIPIMMLSARAEEDDKIRALERAADDYMTKPFSPRELLARIQALLRRTQMDVPLYLNIGHLRIDTAAYRVYSNDILLKLSPIDYRLLHFFATHPNRAYSRAQLIEHVWEVGSFIDDRSIDVQIRRLRNVLDQAGYKNLLQTVRGIGYIFTLPTED